ncbi:Ger(x)C family spore germination protein [Halobacillus salinarum]|uniref:Ger(X)C family spore germination protein n=1 Tax=Halobacillus salinarum TaxID=2932257 RepID=A0ABY4EFW6_9BACI|nr:Ger(x)C family spore germination protein [Halobacillus salinarum]UOQ43342.1 Ger(x)C family spore germination protein [Halobacillus salinarum]
MEKILTMILSLIFLTGCWDQRQYKDINLVLAKAIDIGENDNLVETVTVQSVQRGGDGGMQESSQLISSPGTNVLAARDEINYKISREFDPSKVQVMLFGDQLAKKGIALILDEFYRNPRNNLQCKLAIVEGKASEALGLKETLEPRINKYIDDLLESAIKSTHATDMNMQMVARDALSPGVDFAIPYLTVLSESQLIKYKGLALFHGDSYTGVNLTPDQAQLILLLSGKRGDHASITTKINENEKIRLLNYISINVMKSNQKLKIENEGTKIKVKLKLNLTARVLEYPKNSLFNYKKIEKVNRKLSNNITKDAEEVIKVVQDANSDVFGIGSRIRAYYPEIWEQINWDKEFSHIEIVPEVKVHLVETGIIK